MAIGGTDCSRISLMVLRSLEGFKALHGAELPKQSSGDSIHDPRTEQAKERAALPGL